MREISLSAAIEVWPLAVGFLDRVCEKLDRKLSFSLTRSDGTLYLSLGGDTFETPIALTRLVEDEA